MLKLLGLRQYIVSCKNAYVKFVVNEQFKCIKDNGVINIKNVMFNDLHFVIPRKTNDLAT